MKKRQLIFLVVFLLVCLVIVISVIAASKVTLDAAANKGKIVNVPMMSSIQTAVSDGSKWLYCGADSKFSETSSGGEDRGKTLCGSKQGTDWAYCRMVDMHNEDDPPDTIAVDFEHTGASCRKVCGEKGYLAWGMWSWDGRSESTCYCDNDPPFKSNPNGKYGDPPNVACTFRGGTCRETKSCTTRSECIDFCNKADAYCGSNGVCVCDVSGNAYDSSSYNPNEGGNGDPDPDPSCFLAGTKITMADGTEKNIEDVKKGDKILSWDFEENKAVETEVIWIWNGPHEDMHIINENIHVSSEHPFWIREAGWAAINPDKTLEKHSWKPSKLEVGYHLMDKDGNYIEVYDIEENFREVMTYNIGAKIYKNYFAGGVLVHNKGGGGYATGTGFGDGTTSADPIG